MEAAGSSEMMVTFYHTTQKDISEDCNLLVALLMDDCSQLTQAIVGPLEAPLGSH
jgi:hypothetical protein